MYFQSVIYHQWKKLISSALFFFYFSFNVFAIKKRLWPIGKTIAKGSIELKTD